MDEPELVSGDMCDDRSTWPLGLPPSCTPGTVPGPDGRVVGASTEVRVVCTDEDLQTHWPLFAASCGRLPVVGLSLRYLSQYAGSWRRCASAGVAPSDHQIIPNDFDLSVSDQRNGMLQIAHTRAAKDLIRFYEDSKTLNAPSRPVVAVALSSPGGVVLLIRNMLFKSHIPAVLQELLCDRAVVKIVSGTHRDMMQIQTLCRTVTVNPTVNFANVCLRWPWLASHFLNTERGVGLFSLCRFMFNLDTMSDSCEHGWWRVPDTLMRCYSEPTLDAVQVHCAALEAQLTVDCALYAMLRSFNLDFTSTMLKSPYFAAFVFEGLRPVFNARFDKRISKHMEARVIASKYLTNEITVDRLRADVLRQDTATVPLKQLETRTRLVPTNRDGCLGAVARKRPGPCRGQPFIAIDAGRLPGAEMPLQFTMMDSNGRRCRVRVTQTNTSNADNLPFPTAVSANDVESFVQCCCQVMDVDPIDDWPLDQYSLDCSLSVHSRSGSEVPFASDEDHEPDGEPGDECDMWDQSPELTADAFDKMLAHAALGQRRRRNKRKVRHRMARRPDAGEPARTPMAQCRTAASSMCLSSMPRTTVNTPMNQGLMQSMPPFWQPDVLFAGSTVYTVDARNECFVPVEVPAPAVDAFPDGYGGLNGNQLNEQQHWQDVPPDPAPYNPWDCSEFAAPLQQESTKWPERNCSSRTATTPYADSGGQWPRALEPPTPAPAVLAPPVAGHVSGSRWPGATTNRRSDDGVEARRRNLHIPTPGARGRGGSARGSAGGNLSRHFHAPSFGTEVAHANGGSCGNSSSQGGFLPNLPARGRAGASAARGAWRHGVTGFTGTWRNVDP